MAKNKEQKKEAVKTVKGNLKDQKAIYFVDFSGASTDILLKLRERLKEDESVFYVVKKKLAQLVFDKEKIPVSVEEMQGQLALVFAFGEEAAPAKAIYEFQEKEKTPVIMGGYVAKEVLSKEEVVELAQLPTREELLGRLIGRLNAPVYGLAHHLAYNLKGLMYLLKQKSEN